MRKVFVSTVVLSLCLGLNVDVVAKRKSTRAAKRTVVRAGRSTTSTSSSSSSKTTTVADSTYRFVADSAIYEQKLEYGVKYDLATMLLPSVSDYYKTNGSEAINEQLCFGPYMTLTGISTSGDIVEYTADGAFECQNLLSDYSYTLQLKEATKTTLATFAFPRRVKIVRSGVDVNYMQFEYEPYVDISEFVPKIATAVMDAKTSCQAFYDDMEKLKGQLGWTTGLSGVGTALSAGATGVGVYNVMKTNEVDRKLGQLEKLKDVDENSEGKEENCSNEITFWDDSDEKYKEPSPDISNVELACLKKAKESAQDKLKSVLAGLDDDVVDKKYGEEEKKLPEKKEYENFVEYETNITFKDGTVTKCDNNQTNVVNCTGKAREWGLDLSSEKNFKDSLSKKRAELNSAYLDAGYRLRQDIKSNKGKYQPETSNYKKLEKFLKSLDEKITSIENTNRNIDKKKKLNTNIESSVKTSRTLDKVQMGLNIGSAVTSGGSLILSVAGIKTAESALSNLKECESKISELKLLYNTYKAELEDNGVGEE
ncbi:MAG: hypothetical protein IJZ27_06305 [Treponema sp.]|nr:hypothetical protein [Treponema sp.]